MSKIVKSVFGWKSTLIVLAVFLFTIFGKESLGKIEGDLFPVTTTAKISLIESEEYSSLFWGSTEKLRECEFQRIEWKLGDSSNSIEVGVSFEESSKVRPEGDFNFGPWRIHLTESQLLNKSFAKVYHKCHAMWPTITHFYPDKE